jgi:hypothetical protein
MKQGDPSTGDQQVHGDTVCDRHREQHPGRSRDPAVDTFDLSPAAAPAHLRDLDAVNLVAQYDGVETRQGPAECEPAIHHFADRLITPETQVKTTPGLVTPAGYPGDDTIAVSPIRDLESRDGPWSRDLRDAT